MKKFAYLAFVACILLSSAAFAQCDAEKFMENCNSKLVNGYTFLKSYSIDGGKGKAEYSYVFSKDTNYLLTLCGKDGESKNLVVTLFDSQRKQLASNHDKKSNQFLPLIGYKCSATGIYYLSFSFEGGGDCGGSVLGFKR